MSSSKVGNALKNCIFQGMLAHPDLVQSNQVWYTVELAL
jgi:hypothetical protein